MLEISGGRGCFLQSGLNSGSEFAPHRQGNQGPSTATPMKPKLMTGAAAPIRLGKTVSPIGLGIP
jgi:hypothetical protein